MTLKKVFFKCDFSHFALQATFTHYIRFASHSHLADFSQDAFSSPLLSIMQTFSMMLGDINYHDAFLDPFLRNELAYPFLSFALLITFTMFVPIVLMNLLVSDLSLYVLLVDRLGYSVTTMICSLLISLPEGKRTPITILIHSPFIWSWGCARPCEVRGHKDAFTGQNLKRTY